MMRFHTIYARSNPNYQYKLSITNNVISQSAEVSSLVPISNPSSQNFTSHFTSSEGLTARKDKQAAPQVILAACQQVQHHA